MKFTSKPLPLELHSDFQGSRWLGRPDLLKPMGWLQMISLREPAAGISQPSRGVPSAEGKLTSLYWSPLSAGECSTGERRCWPKLSAKLDRKRSICSSLRAEAADSDSTVDMA